MRALSPRGLITIYSRRPRCTLCAIYRSARGWGVERGCLYNIRVFGRREIRYIHTYIYITVFQCIIRGESRKARCEKGAAVGYTQSLRDRYKYIYVAAAEYDDSDGCLAVFRFIPWFFFFILFLDSAHAFSPKSSRSAGRLGLEWTFFEVLKFPKFTQNYTENRAKNGKQAECILVLSS